MNSAILITIDVEDWFQVENFKPWIPFSSWSSYELRVEKNTHRFLDLLDSIKCDQTADHYEQPSTSNQQPVINSTNSTNTPKATFFVLAWLAERLPHLVREIHARGHEVASHGYNHNLGNHQTYGELKKDLIDSKKLLEDIIGSKVFGYRAPSFSINDDILKIIKDCGYLYDSSYNSFGMNSRYGQVDFSRNGKKEIAFQVSKNFWELPISNIDLGNYVTRPLKNVQFCKALVLPWGGGGYFRLIPFFVFRRGVQSILKNERSYLFYIHPWEIDHSQPKVNKASVFYKFRHYANLKKTYSKLSKLIADFTHLRFITCKQYLSEIF